jgi:hypothetical protein
MSLAHLRRAKCFLLRRLPRDKHGTSKLSPLHRTIGPPRVKLNSSKPTERPTLLEPMTGTHQRAVSHKHLDYYLDEFTFRFNRRRSKSRGKLFFRLAQRAVAVDPVPYDLIIRHEKERDPNILGLPESGEYSPDSIAIDQAAPPMRIY